MNNLVQRYLLRDILSDYVSRTATTDDGRGVTQMLAVTMARTRLAHTLYTGNT